MNKKLLSLLFSFAMLFSILSFNVSAETTDITVYITVSKYGEIVKDQNGEEVACVEVSLGGKSEYTLDDAFKAVHEKYCGEDSYASSVSEWGFGIDKMWNDTSGNFGYQVNGAEEYVSGLNHILKDKDYIDVTIYKNLYPDTESYSKFNFFTNETYVGSQTELTLYASGYDENWNLVFFPCDNAEIIVNGEKTELITDENGKVQLEFESEGKYVVSAIKNKLINDEEVPDITAPVCVMDVKEPLAIQMLHNIASAYLKADFSLLKDNLPWILADLAVYSELFPDSENVLNDAQKEEAVKEIVSLAVNSEKPGDIAKSILALRSLGYDARNIYTQDFKKNDIVNKLCELVENKEASVTNIYTLPYVMIALSQGENYATEEQMSYLITYATQSKEQWLGTEFGTDAMTPMILALAPYYNTDENVKNVIDEAVEVLKGEQREDGLINGFEGYESASTGLAICALSAVGVDVKTVKNGENSLIDGLLSTANDELSGFSNAFATEQGFRGLLAWQLNITGKMKNMYDFSDYPEEELNLSGVNYCPVVFVTNPRSANITVEREKEAFDKCFDLDKGTYTYTVESSGYISERGEIEITEEDVLNHTLKTINISLSPKSYGGGSSGSGSGNKTQNKTGMIIEEKPKKEEEKNTVSADEIFADVKKEDWYYQAVQYVFENNLFGGTDVGFEPDKNMTRAMLTTVLYRMENLSDAKTESYFKDVRNDAWYAEGVNWAFKNKIVAGVSENEFAPDRNITREEIAVILYRYAIMKDYAKEEKTELINSYEDFSDVSEFAKKAMQYATQNGIITGKTEKTIAPKDLATRAEVATMLMRFEKVVK